MESFKKLEALIACRAKLQGIAAVSNGIAAALINDGVYSLDKIADICGMSVKHVQELKQNE